MAWTRLPLTTTSSSLSYKRCVCTAELARCCTGWHVTHTAWHCPTPQVCSVHHQATCSALSFSPSGQYLAAGFSDRSISVYVAPCCYACTRMLVTPVRVRVCVCVAACVCVATWLCMAVCAWRCAPTWAGCRRPHSASMPEKKPCALTQEQWRRSISAVMTSTARVVEVAVLSLTLECACGCIGRYLRSSSTAADLIMWEVHTGKRVRTALRCWCLWFVGVIAYRCVFACTCTPVPADRLSVTPQRRTMGDAHREIRLGCGRHLR